MHVLEQSPSEPVLRQHSFDGRLHQRSRVFLQQLLYAARTLTTGKARVVNVGFRKTLLAAENNFLGIEHDHVISAIYVRSEIHLMLTSEVSCNSGSQSSEGLTLSVYQHPFFINGVLVGGNGLKACCFHFYFFFRLRQDILILPKIWGCEGITYFSNQQRFVHNSFDQFELPPDLGERCNGLIQLRFSMRCRQLNTDARLSFWNDRVEKTNGIHPFFEQPVSKLLR